MSTPRIELLPSTQDDRRREIRISFLPARRPQVQFGSGTYPVLDASPHGFRIRHADAERPQFGADVEGDLLFQGDRPRLHFQGVITRVQAADVAVRCTRVIIPATWLIEEAALQS